MIKTPIEYRGCTITIRKYNSRNLFVKVIDPDFPADRGLFCDSKDKSSLPTAIEILKRDIDLRREVAA